MRVFGGDGHCFCRIAPADIQPAISTLHQVLSTPMARNSSNPGSRAFLSTTAEWLLTFAVLALFAVNFFPAFVRNQSGLLWGVHLYSFFPPLFLALALAAVAILLLPFSGSGFIEIVDRLSGHLPWGNRPALRAAFTGAVFFTLCLLFASKTNFLGDGRILLRNIEEGALFYPSDLVDFGLHRLAAKLLGSGTESYRFLSAAAGGLFAVSCYYLVSALLEGAGARLLGLLWLLSTGAVVQFFGYVESYALYLAALQAYMLFALRQLDKPSGSLLWPSLLASLCCCLHPTGAVTLPSLAYLAACRYRSGTSGAFISRIRFILPAIGGAVLPPLAVIVIFQALGFDFGKLFSEAVSRGSVFLPWLPSPGSGTTNWLFSASHFKDLLNQVMLVAPALVFFPISLSRAWPVNSGVRGRKFRFLGLVCGTYALFFFMMDYKLALFRDWDLFSVPAPVCAVLVLFLLAEKKKIVRPSGLLRYLALNLLALAPFLALNGSEQKALQRFEQLSAIAELHPRAVERAHNFEELGIYYRDKEDLEAAAGYYRKAIALQPNYRYYAYLGVILQQQSKLLECEKIYEESLRLEPNYYPVLYNLGNVYLQLYRPEEAVRCLEKASALQKTDREYVRLGQAFHQADSLAKAIAAFEKAISLSSQKGLGSLETEIAEIRMETGDYKGALNDLRKIMNSGREDYLTIYVFGCLCLRTGSLDAAEATFNKLRTSQLGRWEPLAGLARVKLRRGREAEAQQLFERAIAVLPKDRLEPSFKLARILASEGQYPLAEKVYQRVLESVPGHLKAGVGLARLRVETGAKEQAVDLLESLRKWNQGSAEYWYNLGRAYLAADTKEPAAACIDSLYRLEPAGRLAEELRESLRAAR